ncbi:hypothetical protein [Mycolicibacterium houstonense]|uniref:hypothetical protein n=1 Tax=Mycolicibacterium houstonense TaxID=146021 RepID=UPI001358907F|nr:hypothetical protein [Mycolicibacterium houstonense]
MATTYNRIDVALTEMGRKTWNIADLYQHLQTLDDFKVRKVKDQPKEPMSVRAMSGFLRLILDLGLVETLTNDKKRVRLTDAGRRALEQERFAAQIQARVEVAFDRSGITLQQLKAAISRIKLPDFADADRIYEELVKRGEVTMPENRFRTMMFLLASSGGAKRNIRVHYSV